MLTNPGTLKLCFLAILLSGCGREGENLDVLQLESALGIHIYSQAPELVFDVTNGMAPFSESGIAVDLLSDVNSRAETLKGVRVAYARYSPGRFDAIAPNLYLYEQVLMDGHAAGGFYGPGYIAAVSPLDWNNTRFAYEKSIWIIHHELSSHVLMRNPLVGSPWHKLMPDGWVEAESTAAKLNFSSPYTFDDGFVTSYAATSLENDFNEVAAMTLSEPTRMRRLAAKHPIIAKKLYLLMSVYDEFDPKVKQFFDEQGLRDVAIPVESATVDFKAPEGLFDHLKPVISQ